MMNSAKYITHAYTKLKKNMEFHLCLNNDFISL